MHNRLLPQCILYKVLDGKWEWKEGVVGVSKSLIASTSEKKILKRVTQKKTPRKKKKKKKKKKEIKKE
jgi:hypothetical protein